MKFSSKSLLAVTAFMALGLGGMAGCSGDDEDGAENVGPSSSSSGSSGSSSGEAASSSGGSGGSSGASSSSGGGTDASGPGLGAPCEAECRALALNIVNGQLSGTFDEAQYGINGDGSLHVEVAYGGPADCPVDGSADPEYMLVATVQRPTDLTPLVRGAGLGVAVLGFGDTTMVEGFPPPKSVSGTLTPVAGTLTAGPDGFFAFDIQAEFEGGIRVDGHVFATHCASLDEAP